MYEAYHPVKVMGELRHLRSELAEFAVIQSVTVGCLSSLY